MLSRRPGVSVIQAPPGDQEGADDDPAGSSPAAVIAGEDAASEDRPLNVSFQAGAGGSSAAASWRACCSAYTSGAVTAAPGTW
jgi:hypothetical protein